MGKKAGTRFLLKVPLVFWRSEEVRKEENDPEWQKWEGRDRSER